VVIPLRGIITCIKLTFRNSLLMPMAMQVLRSYEEV